MSEQTAEVESRRCPYVGLDYYRENSGAWFFGREADGDKIITNLLAARLTLLHAESGVGKSSLLRAGVAWRLNRLARTGQPSGNVVDLPVVFSSWKDDPVGELIDEIRLAAEPFLAGRPAPDLPSGQLEGAIEATAYAVNVNLLVILDQFEEYFLYCSREPTPERFADELARCLNRSDIPANFLIAVREDGYAGLGELFKGRIANVYGNYLHIEYLDRASAEQAIRAPLEVYNRQPWVTEQVTIQDGLVDAVLDQVRAHDAAHDQAPAHAAANGNGERFATPLLQLAMETIWKRELGQHSHVLRLSTLETLEGVGKIVDTHVSRALGTLSDAERDTAVDLFDHLVTPSGGKIAEAVPDLANRTGHDESHVHGVLDKLDHERIVRPVPAPPGQDPIRFRRYEIFHDVLAPTINRAIAAREGRRRTQRLRRLYVLAVALLVVAVVLAAAFFWLWRTSVRERQTALSSQLAAVANAELPVDPDMSALLAQQAWSLAHISQAEEALRAALPELQEIRKFQTATAEVGTAFDPVNANLVASAGHDGNAWIWNVGTGRYQVRLSPPGGPALFGAASAVAFNAAGTEVAVGYQNGHVIVFSSSGNPLEAIAIAPSVNSTGLAVSHVGSPINQVEFVGRTAELVIATRYNVILLRTLGGRQTETFLYGQGADNVAVDPASNDEFAVATDSGTRIVKINRKFDVVDPGGTGLSPPSQVPSNAAGFSRDGTELASADSDGVVRVYDVATADEIAALDAGHGAADSVAIGMGDELVVAGYSSGVTIVWDASTRTQLTQLTGNGGLISQVQVSADGREVVTASSDDTIRVWLTWPRTLDALFPISTNSGRPNPVSTAEYSPDGRDILGVDGSGGAYVVTADGSPVKPLRPGHGVSVNSAVYNQAGTRIVTADSDGSVDLWQAGGSYAEITLPATVRVHGRVRVVAQALIQVKGGLPVSASFSPDGTRIIVLTSGGTAEVFNASNGRLLQTFNPVGNSQFTVALFSPDGRYILTGNDDGQVDVWDARTGKYARVLGNLGPGIEDVQFDRTGRDFVTASDAGVITIWSADDQLVSSFLSCPSPSSASLSPGGRYVAVACSGGLVPVYSQPGQELTAISDPGIVSSVTFSPNGQSIITTFSLDQTGGVRVWSSELASPSLQMIDYFARRWIIGALTPAQVNAVLAGPGRQFSTP